MDIDTSDTRTIVGAPRWVSPREQRAHAMKNRLSTIRLIGQLLRPEVSERAGGRLRRLDENVQKLVALIDNELDESEHQDRSEERHCNIDVPALFETVRMRLLDRITDGRVTLTLDCEAGRVSGSEAALAEAIYNLVSNAIEATPPGGRVAVRTQVSPHGEHVWEICDDGPGMSRDVLARLSTGRYSGRSGGTGLGFAIAAAVVGGHGGVVEVAGRDGGGTRMTIRLPAAVPAREVPVNAQSWGIHDRSSGEGAVTSGRDSACELRDPGPLVGELLPSIPSTLQRSETPPIPSVFVRLAAEADRPPIILLFFGGNGASAQADGPTLSVAQFGASILAPLRTLIGSLASRVRGVPSGRLEAQGEGQLLTTSRAARALPGSVVRARRLCLRGTSELDGVTGGSDVND